MPVPVIAWPPVGAVGSAWTVAAPVARSQSLITGRRYVSRWGRERREAAVNVSALARGRSGAGYSEMLIRYLDGGANLVRLNSYPINWHLDHLALEGVRSSQPLAWQTNGNPLAWQTNGQPLLWFTGTVLSGTVSGDMLTVTGLPPGRIVARPGDFVRLFTAVSDAAGALSQVITEATSDSSGVAVLQLFDEVTPGAYARVNIGDSDSRVFEALEMPRAMQAVGSDWQYPWAFREVFEDEVDGGFDEVNPW